LGKALVTMEIGGATLIDMACVTVTGGVEESVTLTVKLKVPTEVVVPLTVPSLAKVSPDGSAPAVCVNVKGGAAPKARMDWL
jgi:hypothetical protein